MKILHIIYTEIIKLREVLYIIYIDSAKGRGGLLSCDVYKYHSRAKSFSFFLRVTQLIPNSSGFVPLITIWNVPLRRDFGK